MKIYYAKNEEKMDYVFLVKEDGKVFLFDCYDDKWIDKDKSDVKYFIPAKDVMDTVDPMDLRMAGGYIDLHKNKVDFPDGIKREFIKFTFNNKMERNS